MAKRKHESNEKEDSKARKPLTEHLLNEYNLDEEFVKALDKGMDEYNEALRGLKKR